jgi:DNA mismatch repair protein MutS
VLHLHHSHCVRPLPGRLSQRAPTSCANLRRESLLSLGSEQRRIRSLFATHYHELTVLEHKLPGLMNLNTEISEYDGEIVFLHRIAEGSASRSYGIHVARLAGVPDDLLENAQEKLIMLESERKEIELDYERHEAPKPAQQLSLFDFASNPVTERLKALNILEITPSQAFSVLEELKAAADESER